MDSSKKEESCAAVAREILPKRGRQIHKETLRVFRHKNELKPWHVIKNREFFKCGLG